MLFGLGITSFVVLASIISLRLYVGPSSFGPGFWAFSFPFAAAVTYAVHWLALEHVRGGAALGYALAGVLTAGFAVLTARTVTGLIDGTFLPRVPAADQPRLTGSAARSRAEGRARPFIEDLEHRAKTIGGDEDVTGSQESARVHPSWELGARHASTIPPTRRMVS